MLHASNNVPAGIDLGVDPEQLERHIAWDIGVAAVAEKIVAESASILKVEVSPNGPYLIKTECLIVHSDGKEETKTGTVALCRCGASANKPYCDGGHRKVGFTD